MKKNVKLIKKKSFKMWYSVWNKDMDVLVSWKHAPIVHCKTKKQQWHRYGDTEQNDSGNTITAQAKDKRTSLSTVDCMDESWCVSSYLITVEMNKWAL